MCYGLRVSETLSLEGVVLHYYTYLTTANTAASVVKSCRLPHNYVWKVGGTSFPGAAAWCQWSWDGAIPSLMMSTCSGVARIRLNARSYYPQ